MRPLRPLVGGFGAGAAFGVALLSRYEAGSFTAVGLGRSQPGAPFSILKTLDLSDDAAARDTVAEIVAEHGAPKVLIHNISRRVIKPFAEAIADAFQNTWASLVKPAILLAQAAFPPMPRTRAGAWFEAFGSAKFALCGLTQWLARAFQSPGIHICHGILDGVIVTERSRAQRDMHPEKMMRPDYIAEAHWQIALQPSFTWPHKLDLPLATGGV